MKERAGVKLPTYKDLGEAPERRPFEHRGSLCTVIHLPFVGYSALTEMRLYLEL